MTLAPNCRDAGPVIAANQSEGSRADLQKVIFQIERGMSDPMEVDQTQPLAMDFALK